MGICFTRNNTLNPNSSNNQLTFSPTKRHIQSILGEKVPKPNFSDKSYLNKETDEDLKGIDNAIEYEDKNKKRNEKKKARNIKHNHDETESDEIYENVKKVKKNINSKDFLFIITCLKSHFVFYNLSNSEL